MNVNLVPEKEDILLLECTRSSYVSKNSGREIDIFPGLDDSIPPGIKSDDFDSEVYDNSTSLPEFESFHVDYPDLGDSTIDVVEDIPVDVPNILPTHLALQLDFDFIPSHNDLGSDPNVSSPSEDRNKIYDPGICIEVESTRFLAPLSLVIDTLLPFSSKNEDKVFNHGVLAYKEKSPPSLSHWGLKAFQLSPESPMMIHGDNTPNLGVLSKPTSLGEVFSLARVTEARLEDQWPTSNIAKTHDIITVVQTNSATPSQAGKMTTQAEIPVDPTYYLEDKGNVTAEDKGGGQTKRVSVAPTWHKDFMMLDFEKEFDSVNWNFLIDTMAQMGFGVKWHKWIYACLALASVSILINVSPSKEFPMKRNLRQGDPFSPFFFLIVAEALQVMITDACNKGLKINISKCRLFGIGVPLRDVENIARAFNCLHESLPFTYLGLPVGRSMRKIVDWTKVINRFSKRLASWKAPEAIINKLESMRRQFFWGMKECAKKICWVSWNKILVSKSDGGLRVDSIKAKKHKDPQKMEMATVKDCFPRLFALEQHKDCLVSDKWVLEEGVWQGKWNWTRQPRRRTDEDLAKLVTDLNGLTLDEAQDDKWEWTLTSSRKFLVASLCRAIHLRVNTNDVSTPPFPWNSWASHISAQHEDIIPRSKDYLCCGLQIVPINVALAGIIGLELLEK
ncbi:RNA-directed DNA polymerase, eukaryota, reverse transcriptase zinc-binding domain protein [Tanacetum coccineum]